MDSPDAGGKVPPAAAARPSPSKDSPFYNYISNLSPLNQNKDTRVGQRLFHVRSPPPVFTSPRETKLVERIQMSEMSTADLLTLCITEDEISSVVSSVPQSSTKQVILIPYTHAFDKDSGDTENQSPPGSIDKYLADTCEDSENFLSPPDVHSDKVVELPRDFKVSVKCGDKRSLTRDGIQNNQKDGKIKDRTQIVSVESTSQSLSKGASLVDANVDLRINKKIDKGATKIVQHIDSSNVLGLGSSLSTASADNRYLRDPTSTAIDRTEPDKQMRDAHASTRAQETQAHKEHETGMTSQVDLEQDMVSCSDLLHDIDLDQFCMEKIEMEAQRGVPRRCLQFQAGSKNVEKINSSRSLSTTSHNMFHGTDSSSETSETLNRNTFGKVDDAVGTKLVPDPCQHAALSVKLDASNSFQDGNKLGNLSTDVKTNSSGATRIPLGIGLHLNSIEKANVGINIQKGHLLTEDSKSLLDGSSNSLRISPLLLKSESLASRLNECGLFPAPNNQKDPGESDNCKVEDIDRMSPKNKRKRSADSTGDEECRRCNCKKSKCLKLYCECFAAGLYCSKPCSCQGCFNKPEYEDKVMETRKLIESRNPIAFAPKVVHSVAVSPKNFDDEGNKTTPASARHKRGCNCKKSMCLKKYCDCFQAGVGCSDACRCEGCKNVFGRKEGFISSNHLKIEERSRWRKESEGKLELVDTSLEMEPLEENDGALQLGHCHRDPSSPRSLFRCSNREIVLPKSWHHSKRHLTSSPDSESSAAPSRGKSPNSPVKSSLSVRILKASAQDSDIQMPAKKNIMRSSWNGFIDGRNILPARDYQSIRCASNAHPCLKSSETLQSHVRLSKAHYSPITPISRFGDIKYVEPLGNCSSKYLEEETPEILKETRSPSKAVKVSSPNQKRVSPPQDCSEGIRSTNSPNVRSGRRFILQSVPSFPPLTPYKNSKKSDMNNNH